MRTKLMLGLLLVGAVGCLAYAYTVKSPTQVTLQPGATATTTSATSASTTPYDSTDTSGTKPVATSSQPKTTGLATTTAITPAPIGSTAGEVTLTAYLTGYAWPDNTPPGSAISNPVIHHEAGGIGTYTDPVTVAVGHSFINGVDILDYKAGTIFYVPNLRKYFIAEDTCGDGDTPQNVPCHNLHKPGNEAPAGAQVWLDLWVGGVGSTQAEVLKCEDAITDLHTVLVNPASNYAVNPGAIYVNSCAQQYGDTIVKQ